MVTDNESYHNENEFYYPDEEKVLQEYKNIVNTRKKKCQQSKTSLKHKGRKYDRKKKPMT